MFELKDLRDHRTNKSAVVPLPTAEESKEWCDSVVKKFEAKQKAKKIKQCR